MENSEIKSQLVKSCLEQDPKSFIPYLILTKVPTGMPNKIRFYSFFKHMLKCAGENSIGKWSLKIEKTSWNSSQDTLAYNFYDEKHKYARLTIIVTEQNDKLTFETMPF